MNSKNAKQAGMLYFLSTLFNKGIAFLTLPIFTRILSTGDYGIVTTYISWETILNIIISMSLYMSIRTFYVDFPNEKEEYINTIITFNCITGIVSILIVFIVTRFFKVDSILLLLCVIHATADSIINNYTNYLMMDYKYVKRTIFMVFPNLLSVIVSIIFINIIRLEKTYLGRIIPMVIFYVIFSAFILILIFTKSKPKINKKYLKYGITLSLPLVFHGAALTILAQSDRTMITMLASVEETGIYSLVYNFAMISTVITTALEGIWVPWFMRCLKERKITEINKRVVWYINIMTYAMIVVILLGPEILKLLSTKEYWEGVKIIPPIVLANYIIFIYTLYVNIEHYYKKTIMITINTIIAASINVIGNTIFIPMYGYIAAAFTTLASYCIAMALHVYCAKKVEPLVYPISLFIKPLLLIILCMIIYYINIDTWWCRWAFVIVFFITILLKNTTLITKYLKEKIEKVGYIYEKN